LTVFVLSKWTVAYTVISECVFSRYVAFLSGLDLGSSTDDQLRLQLLIDLLTGQLGDTCLQEGIAKVTRVIIAGNSLSRDTQDKEQFTKVLRKFVIGVN